MTKKYFQQKSPNALGRNLGAINQTRTLATIWIGMAAGVYGFDGLIGMVFYLICDLFLSIIMCLHLGMNAEPYFLNLQQVFLTGLMGNTMTYMVVWVFIYNLVYIL